jgi:hypothetical protein
MSGPVTLYREIDALGGVADNDLERGYVSAIEDVLAILERRGFTEEADASADLVEALEFYADESAWNQPPVKTVAHELLGPAYENQASKVRLDRGRIARAAIAAATPTTLPTEASR